MAAGVISLILHIALMRIVVRGRGVSPVGDDGRQVVKPEEKSSISVRAMIMDHSKGDIRCTARTGQT